MPARVDFHRTKYGRELLLDTAWVREMPTFLRQGPHALSFHDILLVTAGRGWLWLDGHRYRVLPDRVFFTAPGQVRLWQVSGLDGLCLFFPAMILDEFFSAPGFLERLPFFQTGPGGAVLRLTSPESATLRSRLLAMRLEFDALRDDSVELLRARLHEVLATLARLYHQGHRIPVKRAPHSMVMRYREMVGRLAAGHHGVAPYARELGVSPGHLNALCVRDLGRGAKQVIQDRLVLEARRALLLSSETVARVGDALGFSDPSYFARFFRRETGLSPVAFRRERGGGR